MTSEVRQRRGGNRKKRAKEVAKKEEQKPPSAFSVTPLPETEETTTTTTLWETMRRHPLAMVTPVALICYILHYAFYFFLLQRPDLIASATLGTIQLRPAVRDTDTRQLLIVGTMSSGLEQVAADLKKTLGLEVGFESSDTQWKRVRDGTVSWFHGIRFLPPLETKKDVVMKWSQLCVNHTAGMGFHPKMYYNYSTACSSRARWSDCWSKQCFEVLSTEWGCGQTCPTPYLTTLLQVRHPLRTVESLVTQFCDGGLLNGTIHPAFGTYASALFPDHDYYQHDDDSCIEASANYVINYYQAMLQARSKGLIADMYRVEETSPCEVARLAGLTEASTTVYAPNVPRIAKICGDPTSAANQVMEVPQKKVNSELLSLTWEDLRGGLHASRRPDGDRTVERQIRGLAATLGYSTEQEYTAAASAEVL